MGDVKTKRRSAMLRSAENEATSDGVRGRGRGRGERF
jgi:hypothetical protein